MRIRIRSMAGARLTQAMVTGALLAVALLPRSDARADPIEDFFHNRQVTLLVGGGAGGAVDVYARLLAKHIPRFLPGHPTILAKNLPAAGGIQAFMTLASTAPRDGSAFATSARGPITDPMFLDKPTYDLLKFVWIGSLNEDSQICYTMASSQIRTIKDAMQHETSMAATGATAESAKYPLALNATIGTRFKVIAGYSGAADTHLSVEKGETDGLCTTYGSVLATKPALLQKHEANVLVQIGLAKRPDLPQVPLALDLARSEEDRALLRFLVLPMQASTSFALPPDVPAERVAAWRKAFAETMRDPQFLEDAARINLEITVKTGPEVEAVMRAIYTTPKSVIDRAAQVFGIR